LLKIQNLDDFVRQLPTFKGVGMAQLKSVQAGGQSTQKILSVLLVVFLLAVLTGMVPVPEVHVVKTVVITVLLLVVFLISMAGEQGHHKRFEKQNLQSYAQQHPGHASQGRLSCHACSSPNTESRQLVGVQDYKAQMCKQCGTVLYYTRATSNDSRINASSSRT
jgi:Na+(H+)/acetate symporter ActP